MNRLDIIKLLVAEGLSEKTLASFTDKQIFELKDRMLHEQVSTVPSKPSYKVGPKGGSVPASPKGYSVRKDPNEPTSTILQPQESVLKEKLVGKQKNLDKNKNGKLDSQDFKMLRDKKSDVKEMGRKKPSAGLSKEKKSEVVKAARAEKDIGKKGKGFKEVEKKAKESGAKDPKAVAASAMWKNIKRESVKEKKEVNEWIEGLVESKYHPMTSKREIINLIKEKLNK